MLNTLKKDSASSFKKAAYILMSALSIISLNNASAIGSVNADKYNLAENTVDNQIENTHIRFGFEGGYSLPAAKSFKDKSTKTRVSLKRSPQYTGYVGYEYAPNMFLELSGSHKSKFSLGIKLPDNKGIGRTKAQANTYMLGLNYDLFEVGAVTPYVVLGAGLTQVKPKATTIKTTTPLGDLDILRTFNKTSNSFAWQIGLGGAIKLAENLRLTASAKFHVVNNVKLRYESVDESSVTPAKLMSGQKPSYNRGTMKKTIATTDLALGLSYALPI